MSDVSDTFDELLETLKQQRDELKVRLHLGSLDALEKKWDHWSAEAKAQAKPIREVMEDSAGNVGSALDLVLEEIKDGYERLKNQLKSED